ncbi:hypothetical protein L3Q70_04610 [Pseudoalteromonas sp. CF6-2]|uniref:hypothetical protein n=1 Tax=Pseudoalteromonas sp. CF6-2 TaxID=562716 RepID=UPI001F326A33|nr:hypothetical protein L3Q70_04610 [Pseudoalteromonas sp. CF6-2]
MTKVRDLGLKAIELIELYGENLVVDNMPGFAQTMERGDFLIVYTTPFSGAESLPGQRSYMIDIWYKDKKVFSEYFESLEDLYNCHRSKRSEWTKHLLSLS